MRMCLSFSRNIFNFLSNYKRFNLLCGLLSDVITFFKLLVSILCNFWCCELVDFCEFVTCKIPHPPAELEAIFTVCCWPARLQKFAPGGGHLACGVHLACALFDKTDELCYPLLSTLTNFNNSCSHTRMFGTFTLQRLLLVFTVFRMGGRVLQTSSSYFFSESEFDGTPSSVSWIPVRFLGFDVNISEVSVEDLFQVRERHHQTECKLDLGLEAYSPPLDNSNFHRISYDASPIWKSYFNLHNYALDSFSAKNGTNASYSTHPTMFVSLLLSGDEESNPGPPDGSPDNISSHSTETSSLNSESVSKPDSDLNENPQLSTAYLCGTCKDNL